MDLRESKIDLRDKTNEEKQEIFNKIKQYATGYPKGHTSISEIEKWIGLIGVTTFNMHECYSISSDNRLEVHLHEFSFVMLPYKPIVIK
jgi:hypothetical protein